MNSRRRKIMAASLAFMSIISAKSKINANDNKQITKNYDITKLNVKNSGKKSLAPLFWSFGTIAAITVGGGLIYHFTKNKDDKNSSGEQNPTEINDTDNNGNINQNASKPKIQKKIWEHDPEGIIKFLTWYSSNLGTCIKNSCFNMFLNPVFMESINNYLNKYRDAYDSREEYGKEYEEHKEKCYSCQNDYNTLHDKYKCQEFKKFKSLDLYAEVSAIKDIWDTTRCASQGHEYININPTNEGDPFYDVYNSPDSFYKDLNGISPDLFGNMTSVEKGAKENKPELSTPKLLMVSGGSLKPSNNVGKHRKSDEFTCYELNGQDYFVSGVVLRIREGHSVYAHLLYNKNNELSRVIIQDANGLHNNNKSGYVYEISVDKMKEMLKGEIVGGWRLYDFALLVRKDKFEEHKKFWDEDSLPKFDKNKNVIK